MFEFTQTQLDRKKTLLASQMISIVTLVCASIILAIIEYFYPNFFNYPFLAWGGWESVFVFWPVFVWGLGWAIFSAIVDSETQTPSEKRELLGFGLLTSLLAGVWEEFGYRCVFICFGMLSVIIGNFIFGSVLGWILTGVLVVITLGCLASKNFVLAACAALGAAISIWLALHVDPVYWFYEHALVPLIRFVTFHKMDSVLSGEYGKTFLFGAILANAWFRDGHKYQGIIGYVNSWFVGLILLYAMMTYGLWTAMVIHILYDVQFDIIRFVTTRTARSTEWREQKVVENRRKHASSI